MNVFLYFDRKLKKEDLYNINDITVVYQEFISGVWVISHSLDDLQPLAYNHFCKDKDCTVLINRNVMENKS